jgi:hypothetical protein
MCPHQPPCPPADRPDRHAAHTVAFHPGQGWSLLCNGVIVFDDMGEILPGGRVLPRTARPTSGFPPRREERARALAMRQIRSATASNFVPMPPGRFHPHRHLRVTPRHGSGLTGDWTLDAGLPRWLERIGASRVSSAVRDNLAELKELTEAGRVRLQTGRAETASS